MIIVLTLVIISASTIGIVDVTALHYDDMSKVIHDMDSDAKVYGILVQNSDDIASAIQAFIILKVDVIAMPIQIWKYSKPVAQMIASADGAGILVFGAGTNDRWFYRDIIERVKVAFGSRLQRYIGVKYSNRSFFHSASYNCIYDAVKYRAVD